MDKSEINKFREALKNGEVKFTYTKKDGTVRRAVGTLCEKLIPKETPMDTYEITCIKWDASETDIDEYKLPQHCRVKIFTDTPEDEIEAELSEALTKTYSFCHNGFEYSKLEKKQKKLPAGTILYYDTEKNGYRSFNESQLVEVAYE